LLGAQLIKKELIVELKISKIAFYIGSQEGIRKPSEEEKWHIV